MKLADFNSIKEAQGNISEHVLKTPLNKSKNFTRILGSEIYLKMENEQYTGSFKLRGALNKLIHLKSQGVKSVIACSAGNHAQGVAYGASLLGMSSRIVMPADAAIVKVEATKSYGAEVILKGAYYDESFEIAKKLAEESGDAFIHPYNDPYIISGQGSIALEMFEQEEDIDTIFVSIGGGGMISGVSTVAKHLNPNCKVYGVVSENTPGMFNLHNKKEKVEAYRPTIADGIAVKIPSKDMYENYISKYVDDIFTVSDIEIAEATVLLLERAKTVVEGSGAAVLAAATKHKSVLGKKSALILSGGNIDLNLISQIIEKGLSKKGRLARISIICDDRPGNLVKFAGIIANLDANVMEINHDRISPELNSIREAKLHFLVETKDQQHIEKIVQELKKSGVAVES